MPKSSKATFGSLVREERKLRKIGLREMARRIGVSPTYLSMIERGEFPAPAEDKITAIAKIIGRDRDEMLALGGKVSSDLQTKIMARPREMPELIRKFSEMSRSDFIIMHGCFLQILELKKELPRSPEAAGNLEKLSQQLLAALLQERPPKPRSPSKPGSRSMKMKVYPSQ
jgi:transcriptional regulator with XRE-family HTH domain